MLDMIRGIYKVFNDSWEEAKLDIRMLVMLGDKNGSYVLLGLKVRLHWRNFTCDFALACTFSKENK
jgi:hypothetical protein